MTKTWTTLSWVALVLASGVALAQQPGANVPSTEAYMDAMSKMQQNMPKDHNGNADVDFARMMIPHHQAAVDMAKAELQYGKDGQMRKMADEVVKSQEKEISEMQQWLKKNGQ